MNQVAVIVLNYNYGRYLGACLDSIERQTHPNVRVIVVDDASTDDSGAVMAAFQTRTRRPVELITKPTNLGPAHSYNLALGRLRPEDDYVAVIDADDTWYPSKMSVQSEVLGAADDDVVAVYGDVDQRDETSGALQARPARRLRPGRSALEELLSVSTFVPLLSALIRAEPLRTVQPFDERLRLCDYALWLQLARRGRINHHDHLVGTIRVHGSSMSRSEDLTADQLRLLARNAHTAEERRWARRRGRLLLRNAIENSRRVPVAAQYEYMIRTRDALAPLLRLRHR